ncbi:MAG: thiosulfate sulfurtransferase [Candidatus Omnitrophica bacterium]|nr:thiosulfate sulfurtransferase [Candidatus Omnitrophota bacterium]
MPRDIHIEYISTEEVRRSTGKPGTVIVDARPVDAYNGWGMRGEKRGGHIPSAKSLPVKWAGYIDWVETVRNKGIKPENRIVVYAYEKEDAEKVAARLIRAGYPDTRVYAVFTSEWLSSEELPLERLERYRHLVPAEWLKILIETGTAPGYGNGRFVVCHAHYRNREDYEKGHIPGAVPVDTNSLESQKTWNRRSPEELEKALGEAGIASDTTVILYGRFSSPKNDDPFPGSSAGHLAAFRCAFIMMYAGVRDIRILNGGMQAWEDAGFVTATEEHAVKPAGPFGRKIPALPEIASDLPEAREILADPEANLISVRSRREFTGEVSGYNYIEKKGRIPGAVFGACGSDAYHMENYRNPDHTAREYGEVAGMWEKSGITPDKRNSFYCGTGWRGSEAFFNAWFMGWPRISVFDGGWFEWSGDPENPVETGRPGEVSPEGATV